MMKHRSEKNIVYKALSIVSIIAVLHHTLKNKTWSLFKTIIRDIFTSDNYIIGFPISHMIDSLGICDKDAEKKLDDNLNQLSVIVDRGFPVKLIAPVEILRMILEICDYHGSCKDTIEIKQSFILLDLICTSEATIEFYTFLNDYYSTTALQFLMWKHIRIVHYSEFINHSFEKHHGDSQSIIIKSNYPSTSEEVLHTQSLFVDRKIKIPNQLDLIGLVLYSFDKIEDQEHGDPFIETKITYIGPEYHSTNFNYSKSGDTLEIVMSINPLDTYIAKCNNIDGLYYADITVNFRMLNHILTTSEADYIPHSKHKYRYKLNGDSIVNVKFFTSYVVVISFNKKIY